MVDFFGVPASTTPGLAVLARKSGSPVLPLFMIRNPDGTHRLIFDEIIPWDAQESPEETIRHMTQRYTAVIEKFVRRYPDQWFWLHRRWRVKPGEAGSVPAEESPEEIPEKEDARPKAAE